MRRDEAAVLDVRATIETNDGALISVFAARNGLVE
jgi:hypothetical protein